MHIYFMVLIISTVNAFGNILLKKFQQETTENVLTFSLYNLINALTASTYFLVINRLQINMNMPTFIFSSINAFVVAANIILNICAMSKVSLVVISIVTTAGSIIGTSLFGSMFLCEKITLRLALSIITVFAAVFLPFAVQTRDNLNEKGNKADNKGMLICALLFAGSSLSVIINKLYVNSSKVCDSNSYFFMLNFILIIACITVLIILGIKNGTSMKLIFKAFTAKQSSYIVLRTLTSNFGAMITMVVLTKMNVSLYSVLTASLALIGNAAASRYFFKEDMPAENRISVVLAIIAVILAK